MKGLVINELVPDPPGADAGNEWVELYNGSGATIDLAGFTLRGGPSKFDLRFTFPAGATIANGAYVVVGGNTFAEATYKSTGALGLGNAGTSSDAVRLDDAAGNVVDTVVYGAPNDNDSFVDDTGAVATSLAPKPSSTQSLARKPNGADTDASAVDFFLTHDVTPGKVNATN